MVRVLLDANVTAAYCIVEHAHHSRAGSWVGNAVGGVATCPITEGAFIRIAFHYGFDAVTAIGALQGLTGLTAHEFWPDSIPFDQVDIGAVVGHRQVTDAYLASLARRQGGKLATLDKGLAALHPDVAFLIP